VGDDAVVVAMTDAVRADADEPRDQRVCTQFDTPSSGCCRCFDYLSIVPAVLSQPALL